MTTLQMQIQNLLAEEVAPKKAASLAAAIAQLFTLEAAFGLVQAALVDTAPKTRTPRAPRAAVANTTPVAVPKRTRKAAPAAPAAKPKPKTLAKRDLSPALRAQMSGKKKVYWAVWRQVYGEQPEAADVGVLKKADKALVTKYVESTSAQKTAGAPAPKSRGAKLAGPVATKRVHAKKAATKRVRAKPAGLSAVPALAVAAEPEPESVAAPAPDAATPTPAPAPDYTEVQRAALGL
mgnify:CR=1 FL=1